ncbi:hypothetical protein RM533_12945 [Croceicoccus sp. F390]|uniref:DUF4153 domain-containing protein n=1 Tax=Croceicoccus esteveae TaxID=3075597 RepID=A0ABU2ZKD5_9SPHN|nr:hypothetical protein [Croceicoccus sp. F390]MDT0577074.1 hypothetical protein [Croceicoccus sp. F390]
MDQGRGEWPMRAWLLTFIGILAGALFGLITQDSGPEALSDTVLGTFVVAAFIALALSLERLRWTWAVAASLAIGAVLALVTWNSAYLVDSDLAYGWTPVSAVVAALVILPLFQTIRDEGALRLPPRRVHAHVWADFVIGAVGVLFVGIVLLLAVLIDQFLQLVGIGVIGELWETDWFGYALAGGAFGAVAARLRDRANLLATLLTVKFAVLAVLAPILAVAIGVFLVALPFGGLARFWTSTGSSTAILLACALLGIWLMNAVIGSERSFGWGARALRAAALVLALAILPLAMIGAAGLWVRVDALGLTPVRLWGAITIMVVLAWGAAYLWSVLRARRLDEDALFLANVRLAVAVAVLALLLAVPIVDFGAISTRSQMARLQAGTVSVADFDWRALADDFGPAGRQALARTARQGTPDERAAARYALSPATVVPPPQAAHMRMMTVLPAGANVPPALLQHIRNGWTCTDGPCTLAILAQDIAVLRSLTSDGMNVQTDVLVRDADDGWVAEGGGLITRLAQEAMTPGAREDAVAYQGQVEVRSVRRRQVFIAGEPIGQPFE